MSSCGVRPSVRPSVRLSVCLLRSCILSKRINMSSEFFSPSGSHSILVFCVSNAMAVFWWVHRGVQCRWVGKDRNSRSISGFGIDDWLSVNNVDRGIIYLTNGYRYGDSYYRRWIGNSTQAFEWHQLQWPWVTSKPDFRVTILFNVKYLANGTR